MTLTDAQIMAMNEQQLRSLFRDTTIKTTADQKLLILNLLTFGKKA